MAIDTKLLEITPVSELTEVTGLQEGSLLFYDGSNKLKRISLETFNNLSKTAKPIDLSDVAPTVSGLYKPKTAGTYTNAGGLIAQEGYDTLFFFNGTTWTKSESKFPQAPANLRLWSALPFSKDEQVVKDSVIYIALQNVLATDVPGVSDKWKSLGSDDEDVRIALKYFLEQQSGGTDVLDKTFEISNVASYGNLYGIANTGGKLLSKTGALVSYSAAGVDYNVWQNIPTKANGIKKIIAKLTPYGNDPANLQNANIIGTKTNGDVIPLVMHIDSPPPSTLQTYELDITEYESISVGFGVVDANPNTLTQTIEFYKVEGGQSLENSVKNYIDEKILPIKSFSDGSVNPKLLETYDKTKIVTNPFINGVQNYLNNILLANNTIVSYTEAGVQFYIWKDVPTKINGTKRIVKLDLDFTRIGGTAGSDTNLLGIKFNDFRHKKVIKLYESKFIDFILIRIYFIISFFRAN